MALPATDGFTATIDAALATYSASWTVNTGGFNVVAAGDYVQCTGNSDYSAAHWNADTFGADQYAQVKISLKAGSSDWPGPAVRVHASNNTYYGVFASTNNSTNSIYLSKVVAGSVTDLAYVDGVAVAAGDVLRLEVTGTSPAVLTVKKNGTAITGLTNISDSSSPLTSGYGGICAYDVLGDTTTWLDDFEAGNLGASAQSISPNAISSAETVYSPTVSAGAATIAPNLIASAATVYSPTLGGSSATIAPALVASAAAVYSPTVTPGAVTLAPAAITSGAAIPAPDVLTGACIGGVLQRDSVNARWFYTSSAGTLVLAGFHTWPSLSDSWPTLPIQPFDFAAYLADVVARGCNFVKLWSFETGRYWGDSDQYFGPLPWARTGPGNAADGRPKFDLTQFDADYFARLRQRAILAGNAGVYVCVQLFQGWHIASKGLTYNPWPYHPMAAGNNVNSIDGDTNDDNAGLETRSTSFTAVYDLQKAYVDKVLATLADLDNVFYEIANEEDSSSFAWQTALMDYIRTQESGGKEHLVGLTTTWPGNNNASILASTADWVSLADDLTPDAAPGTKASGGDTDHWVGLTSDRLWVWRSFCRGHNPWYMDEYAGETYGNDTRNNATYQAIRANLGYVLDYAARLDLQGAEPQSSLSSTGYCLASDAQVIAYQDGSGAFTVNLSSLPGVWAVEWLRPSDGATQAGDDVSGGATRTLTPPWAGVDAVALLEKSADEIAPALIASAAAVYSPTVTPGAVTVQPDAIAGSAAIYAPAVTAGAVTLAPDLAGSSAAVYAPAVAPGAVVIAPEAATSAATVYAPAVTAGAVAIAPETVQGGATVYAPDLWGGAILAPDAIASTAQVYAPVLAAGAVTIAVAVVESAAVVYAPWVAGAATEIAPELVAGGAQVYAPEVNAGAAPIAPANIASTAAVFAPEVAAGAAAIAPAVVASVAQVFSPFVGSGAAQYVAPDVIPSAVQVFVAALLVVPAARIYRVPTDDRTFAVEFEDRTYTVQGD